MSKLLDRAAAELSGEFSRENHDMADLVRSALVWVPLSQIQDNPYQPRQTYDPSHIFSLAHSIYSMKNELRSTMGLQQPPMGRIGKLDAAGAFAPAPRLVYSDPPALRRMMAEPDTVLQLMFGHSRLRAFRVLSEGAKALFPEWEPSIDEPLPPIDRDYVGMPIALGFATDEQMWKHAITENSQRKDINVIEEAQAIKQAIQHFGYTYEQAAQPFGYSAKGTVANKIRLLQLPAEVQRDIALGSLTERHGRELLRLADDPKQLEEVHKVAAKGLTVAELARDVTWRVERIKEKKERQRQDDAVREILAKGWTPPGSTEPLPEDRIRQTNYTFDNDGDDKLMLETGLCGSHCQCCVLTHSSYRYDEMVRPDPEQAKNYGLGCSAGWDEINKKRAALRKLKADGNLKASEVERNMAEQRAQRLAKAEEINQAARAYWDEELATLDFGQLWQSLQFWRAITSWLKWGLDQLAKRAKSVDELQRLIFEELYTNAKRYDGELGEAVVRIDELKKIITEIRKEKKAKPADRSPEAAEPHDQPVS